MGLISETRTSLENPQTPLSFPAEWLLDIFNGGRTDSGIRVSEMVALQITAVYCCVEIKAGAMGALDLKIFEKIVNADGRLKRRIAHEHEYWDLIEHEPNCEMSAFTMRKTVQAHRMLWGNGYIELQRDRAGRLIALWPRNPARIKPKRALSGLRVTTSDGIDVPVRPGQMVYATTEGMETESMDPESPTPDPAGPHNERFILAEDILHIPGLSLDGRVGQDVIQLARNAVGLALATEKFGGKFFGNGAVGYGIFKIPGTLAPEDLQKLKQEIQEAWGGENVNRPLALDAGMEYTPTSAKPNEAQFLETRQHQVIEICRIFNVPPHMVGVVEKTSRANTEQIGQEFVSFSLAPDLRAWEQEIKRKVFPAPMRGRNAGKSYGVFFDTWPLVTPSANDLRAFVQAMIQWGVWEPNDARERLHMNPLETEGADATWMQINMAPVEQLFETPALPGAEDSSDPNESTEPAVDDGKTKPGKKGKASSRNEILIRRLTRCYSRLFRDAFGRISRRSSADLAVFRQTFMPVLVSLAEELERHAAALFDAEPSPDALETSKFLAGYLGTMFHRFEIEAWPSANGSAEKICNRELNRAVRALAIEAYRNAATSAAKQETEIADNEVEA
jgi:HK97 family phage portal protein